MLEIRIRNWSAVFLKIGYFIGYWLVSHWKCTGNSADQNGFWSAKCWNWPENGQWLTVISSTAWIGSYWKPHNLMHACTYTTTYMQAGYLDKIFRNTYKYEFTAWNNQKLPYNVENLWGKFWLFDGFQLDSQNLPRQNFRSVTVFAGAWWKAMTICQYFFRQMFEELVSQKFTIYGMSVQYNIFLTISKMIRHNIDLTIS